MSIVSPTTPPGEGSGNPVEDAYELISVPLPTLGEGERSIPIRPPDLVRLLLAEPGLMPHEQSGLRKLARMLAAVFHHQFHEWLTELKELYAPLDPDSESRPVEGPDGTVMPAGTVDPAKTEAVATASDGEASPGLDPAQAFLGALAVTLSKANYVALDLPELEKAISTPNEFGLDFAPDLDLFEHIRVFVRGQAQVRRVVRNSATLFRKRRVAYEAYRQVVIALKFRPGQEFDEYVRADVLYLRMFKDVPYVDMDMHLPEHGTKIKMRMFDKLMISSPLVTGIPALAAKVFLAATISPWMLLGLLAAPISAGVKSFFGYKTARQRYLHHMIRHLYYLTLANNASVITRVVDAGEEEEFKEALLAYFFLWRGLEAPEPWDHTRLDRHVERFLKDRAGLKLNFEIGDALNKLTRLGLIRSNSQGHLSAIPIDDALRTLDEQWDHYFEYA